MKKSASVKMSMLKASVVAIGLMLIAHSAYGQSQRHTASSLWDTSELTANDNRKLRQIDLGSANENFVDFKAARNGAFIGITAANEVVIGDQSGTVRRSSSPFQTTLTINGIQNDRLATCISESGKWIGFARLSVTEDDTSATTNDFQIHMYGLDSNGNYIKARSSRDGTEDSTDTPQSLSAIGITSSAPTFSRATDAEMDSVPTYAYFESTNTFQLACTESSSGSQAGTEDIEGLVALEIPRNTGVSTNVAFGRRLVSYACSTGECYGPPIADNICVPIDQDLNCLTQYVEFVVNANGVSSTGIGNRFGHLYLFSQNDKGSNPQSIVGAIIDMPVMSGEVPFNRVYRLHIHHQAGLQSSGMITGLLLASSDTQTAVKEAGSQDNTFDSLRLYTGDGSPTRQDLGPLGKQLFTGQSHAPGYGFIDLHGVPVGNVYAGTKTVSGQGVVNAIWNFDESADDFVQVLALTGTPQLSADGALLAEFVDNSAGNDVVRLTLESVAVSATDSLTLEEIKACETSLAAGGCGLIGTNTNGCDGASITRDDGTLDVCISSSELNIIATALEDTNLNGNCILTN